MVVTSPALEVEYKTQAVAVQKGKMIRNEMTGILLVKAAEERH